MEDTLREDVASGQEYHNVLILVLMEDTLRDERNEQFFSYRCLNPCFNGRYSQSRGNETVTVSSMS